MYASMTIADTATKEPTPVSSLAHYRDTADRFIRDPEAVLRADCLLRHFLSSEQYESWCNSLTFVEHIHGRIYTFTHAWKIHAVMTLDHYGKLRGYNALGFRIPLYVELVVYPIDYDQVPLADVALINLLLLRYRPDILWFTACINGSSPRSFKNVDLCIDINCRYCNE